MTPTIRDRFRGCLLGGAVGDALGAPVEFLGHGDIVRKFGKDGIRDYVPAYGRKGAITDDTQMTLFTAEGLLRADVRDRMRGLTTYSGVTDHAYLRWLETQGQKAPIEIGRDGWLWQVKDLHYRRAPGNTCLSALKAKVDFGDPARNDSKGCGGVMRVAPAGLFGWQYRDRDEIAQEVFDLGAELAGLTHGHPSGQWPAGVLALLVMRLLEGMSLPDALREAKTILRSKDRHQETLNALTMAEALAASGSPPSAAQVEKLGGGWVAEEALAISVYCALMAKDFEHGITLAVNHSGDSDSTGAIAGNLLGAMLGTSVFPDRWLHGVELREVIESLASEAMRLIPTIPEMRMPGLAKAFTHSKYKAHIELAELVALHVTSGNKRLVRHRLT